jgi:copper chaperone CopZ
VPGFFSCLRLTPYRGTGRIVAPSRPWWAKQETTMTQFEFEVDGMTCGGCSARVQRLLAGAEGVTEAEVTRNPGRARVTLAPGTEVDAEDLAEVIRRAGYQARVAAGGAEA